MLNLLFMPKAWQDLGWWVQNDLKTVKKIYQVLESISKTPFDGIGQPEPLKANYSGYWSRRINLEHRIVYRIDSDAIVIIQCRYHY